MTIAIIKAKINLGVACSNWFKKSPLFLMVDTIKRSKLKIKRPQTNPNPIEI